MLTDDELKSMEGAMRAAYAIACGSPSASTFDGIASRASAIDALVSISREQRERAMQADIEKKVEEKLAAILAAGRDITAQSETGLKENVAVDRPQLRTPPRTGQ